MKKHHIIFAKIKQLLQDQLGDKICEHEEGNYLTIENCEIWLSVDDEDLTIGDGLNHKHYHYKYEDLNNAIDELFNMLTGNKKITKFYKGNSVYKIKTEVQNKKGVYKELSTSLTWLFPYWKKTKKEIEIKHPIIEIENIEKEILQIKNYA